MKEGDGEEVAASTVDARTSPSSADAANEAKASQLDAAAAEATTAPLETPADVTRTSNEPVGTPAESSDSDASNGDEPRLAAPLQTRDPGRYKIIGEHGRGGIGRVLRAHDKELGRDIAVKELLERGSVSEVRFLREALITARLEHPGIVPVHEAGRWPDGTPFYAMKLVSGSSLKVLIDNAKTLEERLALIPNVIAVADAIAYAHDRKIIHRDLKPSNVIVGEFGETVVIDWGLAKALDEPTISAESAYRGSQLGDLTLSGTVLGTPAYMAPEQHDGLADEQADIYALGGILFHCLMGRSLAPGTPLKFPRNTPKDIIAIVTRAMERVPRQRYITAAHFAEDLRMYSRRSPVAARRYSPLAKAALFAQRHRGVSIVTFVSLLLTSSILALMLVRLADERRHAEDALESSVAARSASLLQRDPTLAWSALQSLRNRPQDALLRARIEASGIADEVLQLDATINTTLPSADGRILFISTNARTLMRIDVKTRTLTRIATSLSDPARWAVGSDYLYIVQRDSRIHLDKIDFDGRPAGPSITLDEVPDGISVDGHTVYWTTSAHVVMRLSDKGVPETAFTHALSFTAVKGGAFICNESGVFQFVAESRDIRSLGRCSASTRCNVRPYGGVVCALEKSFAAYVGTTLREVPFPSEMSPTGFSVSQQGLLVASDNSASGWLADQNDKRFHGISLQSVPQGVTTWNDLAAWGFADGTINIHNSRTKMEWSIVSTSETLWCAELLAGSTLATCSRHEVRLWHLDDQGTKRLATLPTHANNIRYNSRGDAAFDGVDGTALFRRAGSSAVEVLHKHDQFAYGVEWCQTQVCSSSLDRTVRCTDPYNSTTTVVRFDSDTWISSGGEECFALASDGEVASLRPNKRTLFRTTHEPYRIAISEDRHYIASGDWAGEVVVFDLTSGHVISRAVLHEGRVGNIVWSKDKLITAGDDGFLLVSDVNLKGLSSRYFSAPIHYLAAASDSIAIATSKGSLWLSNGEKQVMLSDDSASFTKLAISPDGLNAAAGTTSGELLLLTADNQVAARRFQRGAISCLTFQTNEQLSLCTFNGLIISIPITTLHLQSQETSR